MKKTLIAALFAACATVPLHAAGDAAKRFGAREDIQQISLAPDGKHIAFIESAAARGAALVVVDVATGAQKIAATSTGSPDRLTQSPPRRC